MGFKSVWQDGSLTGLSAGKVVCVGRNYAEHVKELNNPIPQSPILFIKPSTALVSLSEPIQFPQQYGACHHEAEVSVLIGATLKAVSADRVQNHIVGYGVGLDLTLRELQNRLKKDGHPWEVAKAFDGACPISEFVKVESIPSPESLILSMYVNDQLRQHGGTHQMLTPIHELIAYMSQFFTLEAGDIVMTGTPAGVSALESGDRLRLTLLCDDKVLLEANAEVL